MKYVVLEGGCYLARKSASTETKRRVMLAAVGMITGG